MDTVELHRRTVGAFGEQVHAIAPGQWTSPTPCADWDVRSLVNHVVGEDRWTTPLFAGATIAEVGDRFDGDLLGSAPVRAWDEAAAEATAAVAEPGALGRTTHLSFGDLRGEDYAMQLAADHLVHAWDLARAIGGDEHLDDGLVEAVATWFEAWEVGYRASGVTAARPAVPAVADPQTRLLAAFGRDARPDDTLSVLRRFNEAFNAHDVGAVMALMTEDCVFEDTSPPAGGRHVGQAAVRRAWEQLFSSNPGARFETEEGIIRGDRATFRWRYVFEGGSVRGVDVFVVRDGRVAEKLSYVKG